MRSRNASKSAQYVADSVDKDDDDDEPTLFNNNVIDGSDVGGEDDSNREFDSEDDKRPEGKRKQKKPVDDKDRDAWGALVRKPETEEEKADAAWHCISQMYKSRARMGQWAWKKFRNDPRFKGGCNKCKDANVACKNHSAAGKCENCGTSPPCSNLKQCRILMAMFDSGLSEERVTRLYDSYQDQLKSKKNKKQDEKITKEKTTKKNRDNIEHEPQAGPSKGKRRNNTRIELDTKNHGVAPSSGANTVDRPELSGKAGGTSDAMANDWVGTLFEIDPSLTVKKGLTLELTTEQAPEAHRLMDEVVAKGDVSTMLQLIGALVHECNNLNAKLRSRVEPAVMERDGKDGMKRQGNDEINEADRIDLQHQNNNFRQAKVDWEHEQSMKRIEMDREREVFLKERQDFQQDRARWEEEKKRLIQEVDGNARDNKERSPQLEARWTCERDAHQKEVHRLLQSNREKDAEIETLLKELDHLKTASVSPSESLLQDIEELVGAPRVSSADDCPKRLDIIKDRIRHIASIAVKYHDGDACDFFDRAITYLKEIRGVLIEEVKNDHYLTDSHTKSVVDTVMGLSREVMGLHAEMEGWRRTEGVDEDDLRLIKQISHRASESIYARYLRTLSASSDGEQPRKRPRLG
ncbi:hypothetical protein VNI00_010436 [Paramarasmius palmivorus]|uniref:Zn(2)-C6 fungal-type domain-containing protein n=1 Tax=Paramarasmius palmivorus TaxID=297713 RepID=A0AAW0CKN0_9AGAR